MTGILVLDRGAHMHRVGSCMQELQDIATSYRAVMIQGSNDLGQLVAGSTPAPRGLLPAGIAVRCVPSHNLRSQESGSLANIVSAVSREYIECSEYSKYCKSQSSGNLAGRERWR